MPTTAIPRAPLLGGLVFLVTVVVGSAVVRGDDRSSTETARRAVSEIALTQAGQIEKQLDRAFAAAFALSLAIEPTTEQSRFTDAAAETLRRFPVVGMLALAPDGRVTGIHPAGAIEGERVGRDLLDTTREGADARAAREARRFTVAGPYGRGRTGPVLFGYLPLTHTDGSGGERFAGFVVTAVRVADLVSASDLPELTARGYDYRLSQTTPQGRSFTLARSTELDLVDPVQRDIELPGSHWTLSIAPTRGWPASRVPRSMGLVLVLSVFAGLFAYDLCRRPELLQREVERRTKRLAQAHRLVMKEVAQRERAETQLLHEASHDALTGLPNRAYLLSQIRHAIDTVRQEPTQGFALLLIGLDRFTNVNDSLGPTAGDELIVAVARRLRVAIEPADFLARVSGDEFGVLQSSVGHQQATAVAAQLEAALARPFDVRATEVFLTSSTGIVVGAIGYAHPEDVLRDATLAMRRANSSGGSRCVVFDETMHSQAVRLLTVEADLRRALERDELRVFFEPVLSLESGRVAGFEALARWQHPEHGLVLPSMFVPVAESSGLVVPMDRWVWREAARQMRALHARVRRQPPISLSVNLSPRQLVQPDLVDEVARILDETGMPPSCFRLELTESMMVDSVGDSAAILGRLKALGIRLLLDDFGTGYSSLSYLHELPIDVLKIDRSFVALLAGDPKHVEIVRTIVTLGRRLGLDVIAEGVDTSRAARHATRPRMWLRARLALLTCGASGGSRAARRLDCTLVRSSQRRARRCFERITPTRGRALPRHGHRRKRHSGDGHPVRPVHGPNQTWPASGHRTVSLSSAHVHGSKLDDEPSGRHDRHQ